MDLLIGYDNEEMILDVSMVAYGGCEILFVN